MKRHSLMLAHNIARKPAGICAPEYVLHHQDMHAPNSSSLQSRYTKGWKTCKHASIGFYLNLKQIGSLSNFVFWYNLNAQMHLMHDNINPGMAFHSRGKILFHRQNITTFHLKL